MNKNIFFLILWIPCMNASSAQSIVLRYPEKELIAGDKLSIIIKGLVPKKKYKLDCRLYDEYNREWQSQTAFEPKSTIFDFEKDAILINNTFVIDPASIFWTAQLSKQQPRIQSNEPVDSGSIVLTLSLEEQHITTKTVKLWFRAPDVVVKEVRYGQLVGRLHTPINNKGRANIILLGHSGGGYNWQNFIAGLLASKGYNCLALAYFKMPNLPPKLENIPVEYVQEAVSFFTSQPTYAKSKIGILGYSRGAEYALLSASLLPQIKFVIGYTPSYVVYESVRTSDTSQRVSSWSFQGKELAFVPRLKYNPVKSMPGNFYDYLADSSAVKNAIIPVEKIQGPILLFSGTADNTWPADYMGNQIIKRLLEKGFKYSNKHYIYENAGHYLARPGYMPTAESALTGGGLKQMSYAHIDSWNKTLSILRLMHSK